ncbi:MAG: ABC-2 family transporter protein [Myxococcota bacterium]
MHSVRVVAALMRTSVTTAMQYRSDFMVGLLSGLGETLVATVPLFLVYQHTESVLGWGFYDTLLVMGLYLLMNGLVSTFVEPNLGAVVEGIRSGALDHVLLKPADGQLLVSLSRISVDGIWDALAAIVLIAWCLANRAELTALDLGVGALMFGSGLVAIYGIWLLAICTSFFFVRVDNLRFLLWSAAGAGRWPVGVYGTIIRLVLTFAFPVALVTTFPAVALRGQWDLTLVATGLITSLGFLLGSRWAWTRSLAAYTSASS